MTHRKWPKLTYCRRLKIQHAHCTGGCHLCINLSRFSESAASVWSHHGPRAHWGGGWACWIVMGTVVNPSVSFAHGKQHGFTQKPWPHTTRLARDSQKWLPWFVSYWECGGLQGAGARLMWRLWAAVGLCVCVSLCVCACVCAHQCRSVWMCVSVHKIHCGWGCSYSCPIRSV